MLQDRYQLAYKLYPYERSADQDLNTPARHQVAIIGGGPIGLAMALDLARQNIDVVVLDDHEGVGMGSRAICFAKRSLEIAHRYGCGAEMVEKGVIWQRGKVFQDDRLIYEFDLLPEGGHRCPAFVNLQQPYVEKFLHQALTQKVAQGAPVDMRGKNRVDNVVMHDDFVALSIMTPEGPYQLEADWVIACDGARSATRDLMGLGFEGRVFEDSFLIADIKMTTGDFPTERWFWFEPWFKSGASTLLHKQPDDIWRVDFQIGWDVDRDEELKEENIRKRLDAMLGADVDYEIVWSSIYTFQCRRMEKFRHNRVIFAGDAAHQVSPFGARGANSGLQDVDNLGWKLGLVVSGKAPASLLDSYDTERVYAADENIANSTRATDFITPKSQMSKTFRNAALALAEKYSFARPLVNSGRLSAPSTYEVSELNSVDMLEAAPQITHPGAPCPDAPVGDGFLLDHLGDSFTLLALNMPAPEIDDVDGIALTSLSLNPDDDPSGTLAARYLGEAEKALYLIRPDQHIAARWAQADAADVTRSLRIACGKE